MNGRSDRAWESLGFRGSGFLMLDALWMRCQNIGLSGSLAQSVEHRTFNPLVARSSRARPTRFSLRIKHGRLVHGGVRVFRGRFAAGLASRMSQPMWQPRSLCDRLRVLCIRTSAHPPVRRGRRPDPRPLSRRVCRAALSLFSVICYRNNPPNRHGKFLFRIPLIRDRAI